ncbi:MAG: translation elongation factor Ts [Clostridiales Family XIII bacterium]|jgi:elongation factor Ts|nr:translation elongation factor Ts [Clostridiales Family XIII bacterium]
MAEITAAKVKELRERTGAGMLDCKNVLVETDGDIDKSIDVLREKGLAKAAKKAGRIAAEGLVRINLTPDGRQAAILEVNSETDFVAKNKDFIDFVENLSDISIKEEKTGLDEFLEIKYDEKRSIKEKLTDFVATIGENIHVRRVEKHEREGTVYVGYLHGAGKIGVIIGLETTASAEDVNTLGKDIAMQVASMNPRFIDESQVDPEYIEKEKEILVQQALNEGKPKDIVEKMVQGRLKKELKETCLLEQKFVKNGDITVGQYLADSAKVIGKDVKVVTMVRYEVGEGIEKRQENFAEEVAKQMGD